MIYLPIYLATILAISLAVTFLYGNRGWSVDEFDVWEMAAFGIAVVLWPLALATAIIVLPFLGANWLGRRSRGRSIKLAKATARETKP